jgi:hypothetical protein
VFYKAYFVPLRQGFNLNYSANFSFIQILLDDTGRGLTVDALVWVSWLILSYGPVVIGD